MIKKWLALAACLVLVAGANFAQGQQTPQWRTTSFKGMTVVTPCIWQFGPKDQTYFGAGEVPEQAYDLSVITSYGITDTAAVVDTASCPLYGLAMIMRSDTAALVWEPCVENLAADKGKGRIEGDEYTGIFDIGNPCVKLRYRVYRYEPLKRQWEILVLYLDEAEEQMVADRILNSIEFGDGAFVENEPLDND